MGHYFYYIHFKKKFNTLYKYTLGKKRKNVKSCFKNITFYSNKITITYDKLCFFNQYSFTYYKSKYNLYNIPVPLHQAFKEQAVDHSMYTSASYTLPRFMHKIFELFKSRELYDLYSNNAVYCTILFIELYSKKYQFTMFLKSIVGIF
jgi:hypothetical protein